MAARKKSTTAPGKKTTGAKRDAANSAPTNRKKAANRKKTSQRKAATRKAATTKAVKKATKKAAGKKKSGKITLPPEDPAAKKRRARQIAQALVQEYPDATCALNYTSPLELLVATILSAQCTDERVNQVTPDLFARYPSAGDYAAAPREELEEAIQSTGFFRNKAKSIQNCCRQLDEEYDGKVPRSMEAMVELAGVGRKTANVVLGTAYGIASGVVVDTHVSRLSQRLALTAQTDPVKIEQDLMQLLPESEWVGFAHRMILHGRRVCSARKPKCGECRLAPLCPQVGVE